MSANGDEVYRENERGNLPEAKRPYPVPSALTLKQ